MPFPAITSNQVLKIACKSPTPDKAVEIESQLGVTSSRYLTRLGGGANIHLHEGGSAENEVPSLLTPVCSSVDDQCEGPNYMADLPSEHGSAKVTAGLRVRIVAKESGIDTTPRWLRRLLLALNSCGSLPEMIHRMATSPLVFAPEAIRTPEACDVRFGPGQERRN